MRVCHCHHVTDREILSLVREDVTDVEMIGAFCGAGAACGGCRPAVEQLVAVGQQLLLSETVGVAQKG